MWLMLQQDEPDDYVICSGTSRAVRDLVAVAFGAVGLDWEEHVRVDPAFVRPPDPVPLVGNPAKAYAQLGWHHQVSFEDMIGAMVEHDLRLLGERAPA
jgi:GDPmannose 4,6-dehydratase